MKKLILLLIILSSGITFAQDKNLIGTWIATDNTNAEMEFIFDEEGYVIISSDQISFGGKILKLKALELNQNIIPI